MRNILVTEILISFNVFICFNCTQKISNHFAASYLVFFFLLYFIIIIIDHEKDNYHIIERLLERK